MGFGQMVMMIRAVDASPLVKRAGYRVARASARARRRTPSSRRVESAAQTAVTLISHL